MAEEDKTTGKLDMTELGVTGLKQHDGIIMEEQLRQLSGHLGSKIYNEMEDNEAVIGGVLFAIEALIKQVEWSVLPASEATSDKEAADFLESNLNDMEGTWGDTISESLTMLVHGFAPLETVFKVRKGPQPLQLDKPSEERVPSSRFNDGKIGWKKHSLRAQDTIHRWKLSRNGDIEGFWQMPLHSGNVGTNIFIPIEKVLLFRTTSKKNNPTGRSILRNAYRPWFFKKKIENLEAIGVERDLAGLPMAKVPPEIMSNEASPEEKAIYAKIKEIVTNVRRDEQEGVIFPQIFDDNNNPMYEFSLLSTGGSRQFKTSEIITRYRTEIAIVALADFILLGHEKVGSFSLASSKTNLFTTALRAWLQSIADVFNRTAIPLLFRVNNFSLEVLPQLTFGDIESVDLTALGAFITALTGAGIDLTDEKTTNYIKGQANLPLDSQE